MQVSSSQGMKKGSSGLQGSQGSAVARDSMPRLFRKDTGAQCRGQMMTDGNKVVRWSRDQI